MAAPGNEKRYMVVVSSPEAKNTKTATDPTQFGRRWDNLPEDLVGEIMVRLSPADRIRLAACCNKFWSIMPEYNNREIDHLPWLVEPYLKYPLTPSNLSSGYEFKLFDPIHETPYSYTCVHEISGQFRPCRDGIKLLASKHGWLLSSWEKKVGPHSSIVASFVLVSPFTKQIVALPDLDQSSTLIVATFSAEPSSPNCVYFVFHCDHPYLRVSTFRNGDSEWKTVQCDWIPLLLWIDGMVYHERSFYCSSFQSRDLAAYDVNRNQWEFVLIPEKVRELSIRERNNGYSYLLVCEGKLIFVYLLVPSCNGKTEDQCLVFEYDQSDWAEKTSLGNHALFLHCSGSFSVSTSSDIANRIYYYRPGGGGEKQYYSLEDCKTYQCGGSSYFPGIETSGTWIEPPHLHVTQRSEKDG